VVVWVGGAAGAGGGATAVGGAATGVGGTYGRALVRTGAGVEVCVRWGVAGGVVGAGVCVTVGRAEADSPALRLAVGLGLAGPVDGAAVGVAEEGLGTALPPCALPPPVDASA
jgi:hypothetical protein